ncbi:NADH-quinone oxidoreductase subunit NuoF [Candidatus Nitronereus thalassa]|uniref:NADH-quinone oxidoreductase subunit NuoF n=1 Tax=Candidatus Nitronereus thalassa TaxID=3020898 RepID=A0ABU3K717_9BACT|nr:NADH-quinone oxidoreductase subunit NuoF [Candidatus Nitronereus thalassa]MDT7042235.1 NADH-quinone oxidoreductase subunit NuoF [Candidatus Nitronereus thalassa]
MTNNNHLRLLQPLEGNPWNIEAYCQKGGYEAWQRCLRENNPDSVISTLKRASLRGRGGAGFPTGLKWEKVFHHRSAERYFVCNAGEHEPGTFKDRHLITHSPHQLIEGCLIASFTVGAKESFIYLNAEFTEARANLEKAMGEARERGFLGKNILGSGVNLEIEIYDGHGSYVAGEETAMLESMQGRPAQPKQKPPFYPTDFGLHGKPTLVNNVETLSHVPHILRNGPEWFTQVGPEQSPGTMLFSLSGAVNRPGVYELPLGTSLRHLIEECGGGVPNGKKVKAVFPGGPSFAMIGPDQLDLHMDFDSLKKAGTGLGSAGVIVVDDATCMVRQTLKLSSFFREESCGQCPPCYIGTENLEELVKKIEEGQGTQQDLDRIMQISGYIKGTGFCTLVTGASVLVQNSLRLFRSEFDAHVANHACPFAPAPV